MVFYYAIDSILYRINPTYVCTFMTKHEHVCGPNYGSLQEIFIIYSYIIYISLFLSISISLLFINKLKVTGWIGFVLTILFIIMIVTFWIYYGNDDSP